MSVTLIITADDGQDLRNQMKTIISGDNTTANKIAVKAIAENNKDVELKATDNIPEQKPPAKRGRKAVEKAETNQADLKANPPELKDAEPATAPVIAKTEPAAKQTGEIVIDAVACETLGRSLAARKGLQAFRDVLMVFKVNRMSEVPAEKYTEFHAAMQKKMEA